MFLITCIRNTCALSKYLTPLFPSPLLCPQKMSQLQGLSMEELARMRDAVEKAMQETRPTQVANPPAATSRTHTITTTPKPAAPDAGGRTWAPAEEPLVKEDRIPKKGSTRGEGEQDSPRRDLARHSRSGSRSRSSRKERTTRERSGRSPGKGRQESRSFRSRSDEGSERRTKGGSREVSRHRSRSPERKRRSRSPAKRHLSRSRSAEKRTRP